MKEQLLERIANQYCVVGARLSGLVPESHNDRLTLIDQPQNPSQIAVGNSVRRSLWTEGRLFEALDNQPARSTFMRGLREFARPDPVEIIDHPETGLAAGSLI